MTLFDFEGFLFFEVLNSIAKNIGKLSMSTFYFETEQLLPIDINMSWKFFSSAENLSVITPPAMDFKILTALGEGEIYEGMLIDYTVKPLWGLKFHWKTEICKVDKPLS